MDGRLDRAGIPETVKTRMNITGVWLIDASGYLLQIYSFYMLSYSVEIANLLVIAQAAIHKPLSSTVVYTKQG